MKKIAVITHDETFVTHRKTGESCLVTARIEYFHNCEIITIKIITLSGNYTCHEVATFSPSDAARVVGVVFSLFDVVSWKILDFDDKYEESFIDSCVSSFV